MTKIRPGLELYTRKAFLYFTLASVLFLLALLFQDWQLAILILPIATIFSLVNAWGLPEGLDISLERRITPSFSFGDEDIRVELSIRNGVKAALGNIEVHDLLPIEILPEKGTNHVLVSLDRGEEQRLVYDFIGPQRGHHVIGPTIVRVQDYWGLYLIEREFDPDILVVAPRPEKVTGTELRPRHVGPWIGTIPSRATGAGAEFYMLRGYQSGDEPKRINWKASARYNALVVNETEAERVTDVMMLLDTDVTFFRASEAELFERAVRAAASMASLLFRQGNRVGLILQGKERGMVQPGFGKRHERKILYTLSASKPGRAVVSTSYVLTLLAGMMLPSRAQVVIISSLLDPGIVSGVRDLVSDGYSVLVVSPTPSEPSRLSSEPERIAFGIIALERDNTLLSLERICPVIEWPAGVSFSTVLKRGRQARQTIRVLR